MHYPLHNKWSYYGAICCCTLFDISGYHKCAQYQHFYQTVLLVHKCCVRLHRQFPPLLQRSHVLWRCGSGLVMPHLLFFATTNGASDATPPLLTLETCRFPNTACIHPWTLAGSQPFAPRKLRTVPWPSLDRFCILNAHIELSHCFHLLQCVDFVAQHVLYC